MVSPRWETAALPTVKVARGRESTVNPSRSHSHTSATGTRRTRTYRTRTNMRVLRKLHAPIIFNTVRHSGLLHHSFAANPSDSPSPTDNPIPAIMRLTSSSSSSTFGANLPSTPPEITGRENGAKNECGVTADICSFCGDTQRFQKIEVSVVSLRVFNVLRRIDKRPQLITFLSSLLFVVAACSPSFSKTVTCPFTSHRTQSHLVGSCPIT